MRLIEVRKNVGDMRLPKKPKSDSSLCVLKTFASGRVRLNPCTTQYLCNVGANFAADCVEGAVESVC